MIYIYLFLVTEQKLEVVQRKDMKEDEDEEILEKLTIRIKYIKKLPSMYVLKYTYINVIP